MIIPDHRALQKHAARPRFDARAYLCHIRVALRIPGARDRTQHLQSAHSCLHASAPPRHGCMPRPQPATAPERAHVVGAQNSITGTVRRS